MTDRNKKGQFTSNNKGKPKGSKNKASKIGKDKISEYLETEGYDALITEIKTLEGINKVKAITDLMTFVLPKLKAVDHTSGGEVIPYSLPPIGWVTTEQPKKDNG